MLHLLFRFLLPPSRGTSVSPDIVKHGPFSKNSSFLLHVCKHAHLFIYFFSAASTSAPSACFLPVSFPDGLKRAVNIKTAPFKCTDFVNAEAAKVSQVYFVTTLRSYVRTFAALTF